MTDRFRLDGKVALVTGGAHGIGAAVATVLAEAGADIAITVIRKPGDDTLRAIAALGRHGIAVEADMGSLTEASAAAPVQRTVSELGRLDILVNNAGIIHRADLVDHAFDDWRRVLSIDLDACWLMAQAAARQFINCKSAGRIITVSPILGFQGGIRVPAYTAAKHALIGMTKVLCNELAPRGITANAVAPGYTVTDNTTALRADAKRSADILARIPAGRWAEASDIAGAVVFLAGDAAAYVNGHTLVVDGGWMAR